MFGTVIHPVVSFLPMTGITIDPDPGLFSPKVMIGLKDVNLYALFGQLKNAGGIDAPFYPTNGVELFIWAIGGDGGATSTPDNTATPLGVGITGQGVAGGWATTLSAPVAVSDNAVVVTSAAGITVGDYFQVDVNVKDTTSAEVFQVTSIAGSTVNFTAGSAQFSHLTAAAVRKVIAPFFHNVVASHQLPSFTVEKNVGSFSALQFGGCRVNKFDIKAAATDSEVAMTCDVEAKIVNILGTSDLSPASYVNESPFIFNELALCTNARTDNHCTITAGSATVLDAACVAADNNINGTGNGALVMGPGIPPGTTVAGVTAGVSLTLSQPAIISSGGAFATITVGLSVTQASTFDVSIDNGLKATYTFNGLHSLQYLTPASRHVSGSMNLVWFSYDDPSYGYTTQLMNGTAQGSIVFSLVHPPTDGLSPNNGMTLTIPNAYLAKAADEIKIDDLIMQSLNYEGYVNLANASAPQVLSAVLANNRWLTY